MTEDELVACLEALLFASGKPVEYKVLQEILNIDNEKLKYIVELLENKLKEANSGIQLIRVDEAYQLATIEKYYDYVCKLMDNRPKPSLSQAAMEVLAIIAYNPKITRAEVEKIRGVSSDSAINKLLEYGLIEESGRIDAPGRPMAFKTSDEFLRLFGYSSLKDMPELPQLKEDDGQIEIGDITDKNQNTEKNEELEKANDSENTKEIANTEIIDNAEVVDNAEVENN